ncbi:hypothetical protein PIB30_016918 [Stylosanthes scabra]|uniref:RNase H type-1 domain-containing protein n=1 Tax=Stylosanthes scabra TaxID=79078 RepID=A0ABU6W7J6_9FABA|nr:hypothetical protein [Stylosanthes scabra]
MSISGSNYTSFEVCLNNLIYGTEYILPTAREFISLNKLCNFTPPLTISHWQPPDPNVVKLNCDASVISTHGIAGFGCVLHDYSGSYIKACSSKMSDRDLADKIMDLRLQTWEVHFEHTS